MEYSKTQMVTELVSAFIRSHKLLNIDSKELRTKIIEAAFETADEIEEIDLQRKSEKNKQDPEWQMYNTGFETVERIMKLNGIFDLESELRSSTLNLPEGYRVNCYRHMHTLFTNVISNRLNEFEKKGDEKGYRGALAQQAKLIIGKILHP